MKQLTSFICTIILLSSCHDIDVDGSGNVIKEKRSAGSFTGVSASNGIEVEVMNGEFAVVVEADDNLQQYIETTVSNNTLRVRIKDNVDFNNSHVKVFVSAPVISRLSASSAGEIGVKGVLAGPEKITLNSSSAAKIDVAVDAPSVSADASSSGEITIKGRTKEFRCELSSAADINAGELLSEVTEVEASSAAEAHVHSSVSLKATASSGANISYRGGGATEIHKSSGGGVNKE